MLWFYFVFNARLQNKVNEVNVALPHDNGFLHVLAWDEAAHFRQGGCCGDHRVIAKVLRHSDLAAPFAIIGSIGVVAQIPNFNRLLKQKGVDFEQITAGEYKRTLSLFGENTEAGREKMQTQLESIHEQFKQFIRRQRPQVDIEEIATGDHWLGEEAKRLYLVDELKTSDAYILEAFEAGRALFQVQYEQKKSLGRRFHLALANTFKFR